MATVIIGLVVEKSDEKTLPLARNSNSVRFGYWDVRVERYLVTTLPYTEITVRLEQMIVSNNVTVVNQQKWDGSGPEKIIVMKR